MPRSKFYWDLVERTIWTAVQSFVAILIVEQDWTPDALKIAAVAAVIAVLKGIAATQIGGDSSSAATLPVAQQE